MHSVCVCVCVCEATKITKMSNISEEGARLRCLVQAGTRRAQRGNAQQAGTGSATGRTKSEPSQSQVVPKSDVSAYTEI